jgi:hypothetical protein
MAEQHAAPGLPFDPVPTVTAESLRREALAELRKLARENEALKETRDGGRPRRDPETVKRVRAMKDGEGLTFGQIGLAFGKSRGWASDHYHDKNNPREPGPSATS